MSDTPIHSDEIVPAVLAQPLASPDASATEQSVPDGGVDDSQSVISTLRGLRSRLGAQSPPFDVVVPGYDDLLIVRCKWVPFKDLNQGAKDLQKITEPTELQIAAAADTFVTTCQELLIRVDNEVRPLAQDGVPINFGDPRLPELLGFAPTTTARDAVRAVFANEYSLITTANSVVEWLQDTTRNVDKAFLGN